MMMIIIQGYLTWILKFLSNKAFLTTTTTSISEKQQQSQKNKTQDFFFFKLLYTNTQNKSGENSIGANAFVLVSNISPFLGSVCFVKKKKKS
jgi:chorismate synthase